MITRKERRIKRAGRARYRLDSSKPRISVFKSSNHIYAQLIEASRVVAQASTLDRAIKELKVPTGNVAAAVLVGKMIAEKALQLNIKQVCFDCSGFKYHGRIKGLADSARSQGLKI
jgi:large subunit ribosomal protein L18